MFHDPPVTGNVKVQSGHYVMSHTTTSIDTTMLAGHLVAGVGRGAQPQ